MCLCPWCLWLIKRLADCFPVRIHMPLWQLKDKRASVDRKENIQSSHLGSAAWTAPEQGSTEKRRRYKGSTAEIGQGGELRVCARSLHLAALSSSDMQLVQKLHFTEGLNFTAGIRWLASMRPVPSKAAKCWLSQVPLGFRCFLQSSLTHRLRASGQTEGCLRIPAWWLSTMQPCVPLLTPEREELPTHSLYTLPPLLLLAIPFPNSHLTFLDVFPEPHLLALSFAAYVAVPFSVFFSGWADEILIGVDHIYFQLNWLSVFIGANHRLVTRYKIITKVSIWPSQNWALLLQLLMFDSVMAFQIFFLLFLSIKALPFVSFAQTQAKACADFVWQRASWFKCKIMCKLCASSSPKSLPVPSGFRKLFTG